MKPKSVCYFFVILIVFCGTFERVLVSLVQNYLQILKPLSEDWAHYISKFQVAVNTSADLELEFKEKQTMKIASLLKNASSTSRPLILVWNRRAKVSSNLKLSTCGGSCDITKNRKNLDNADAVVIQMKYMNRDNLPLRSKKSVNQVMIWYNRESSWTTIHKYKINLENYDGYFNWTMTYRNDSDVNAMMIPYQGTASVENHHAERIKCPHGGVADRDIRNIVENKTKTVIWAAGDCGFTSGAKKRMSIVKDMKKHHVSLDIFGKCGGGKYLPNEDFFTTLANYKFYLAFENSYHCKDYVTEKVWYNSFYVGLVPIIWGPAKTDLNNLLPHNSFIYYEDFADAGALAKYLEYLEQNQSAYLEYFKWRLKVPNCFYPLFNVNDKSYATELLDPSHAGKINGFCNLCQKLRDKDHIETSKVIPSLARLWFDEERKECII